MLAAAVLLGAALEAQISLSDLWIRFPDGTIQTTAAHNCFNPADPADEMIRVGGVCIDKYEASVWSGPDGGIQYGVSVDDYPCSNNGQDCFGLIYARSVPGVTPSSRITWFQSQQALANSGKRLPTSAEWQMAVAGTPDDSNCNTSTNAVSNTGVLGNCVSDWGAFDMVGNLWEWVADWGDNAVACTNWSSTYGGDFSCVGLGEAETNSHLPGALFRGGHFGNGAAAGPFAVGGFFQPSDSGSDVGFRGAR
ncbi:MAG TPA: SUMF1/EgtB/PvdO family nonheme iron enzyme [Thermoanaerobaculia bacterium]|nr:SUMF1/EgtB/PvdO family nonheme iron enzyme [Thermoanaerobaculia bacterium]